MKKILSVLFIFVLCLSSVYALSTLNLGSTGGTVINNITTPFNNTNIAYLNQTQTFTKNNTFANKTIFLDNITISKSQTLDPLSAATAHININNPSSVMQTQMVFTRGTNNEIMGGVRVDYAKNFNWHGPGSQGHQFYQSVDTSNVVGAFGGDGLYINPGVGTGTVATKGNIEIVQDTSEPAIYITKNEHSSADASDISLHDSQGTETFGMASWNGGGSGYGYGGMVLGSDCASGGCRLGEISGKNQNTNIRTASIIFETDEDNGKGDMMFYGYDGSYNNALRIDDSGTVQVNGDTSNDQTAQLFVKANYVIDNSVTQYSVSDISGNFYIVENYDYSYFTYYSGGYYNDFGVYAYYDSPCGRVYSPSGVFYGSFQDGNYGTNTIWDLSVTQDAVASDFNAATGYVYVFYDGEVSSYYYKDVGTSGLDQYDDGTWTAGLPDVSVTTCDYNSGAGTIKTPAIFAQSSMDDPTKTYLKYTPNMTDGSGAVLELYEEHTEGDSILLTSETCESTSSEVCDATHGLYSYGAGKIGLLELGTGTEVGKYTNFPMQTITAIRGQLKLKAWMDAVPTEFMADHICVNGECQSNAGIQVRGASNDQIAIYEGDKRCSYTLLGSSGYIVCYDDGASAYNFDFDFDAQAIRLNAFRNPTGGLCIGGTNATCDGNTDTTAFYDKSYFFKDAYMQNIGVKSINTTLPNKQIVYSSSGELASTPNMTYDATNFLFCVNGTTTRPSGSGNNSFCLNNKLTNPEASGTWPVLLKTSSTADYSRNSNGITQQDYSNSASIGGSPYWEIDSYTSGGTRRGYNIIGVRDTDGFLQSQGAYRIETSGGGLGRAAMANVNISDVGVNQIAYATDGTGNIDGAANLKTDGTNLNSTGTIRANTINTTGATVEGGAFNLTGVTNTNLNLYPNTYVGTECANVNFDSGGTRQIKVCRGIVANMTLFNGYQDVIGGIVTTQRTSTAYNVNVTLNATTKLDAKNASIQHEIVSGNFTLTGQGTVWNDVVAPLTASKIGVNAPSFDETNYSYYFADVATANLEQYVFADIQTPHWMRTTTTPNTVNIGCHIHGYANTVEKDNVTFKLDYMWTNIGDKQGGITSINKTQQLSGVAMNNTVIVFPTIDAVNKTISSSLKMKLTRTSATAPDNSTANFYVDFLDCHFEQSLLGSDTEYS